MARSMDYARRAALLKKTVREAGLDSFLVTRATNVRYLSGFTGNDAMMLLTPNRLFFLTDSRYVEEARASTRGCTVELVTESTYKNIGNIASASRLKRLGFESNDLTYEVAERFRLKLPKVKTFPVKDAVESLRSVKEPAEVSAIRNSVRLTKSVFARAVRSLLQYRTEESLARSIEIDFIRSGARPAFDPIVACGPRASKPHAAPGPSRIRRDSFVMLDIGCRLHGYCSDMTRTVITGSVSERFAEIYNIVRAAQKRALARIREGVRVSEVDFAARGYISSMGFGKNFGHSLGHGVGMDIHETPTVSGRSDAFLKAGMVMTVEPAIYIPGFGGVRIEDMVLVTKKGCEILT